MKKLILKWLFGTDDIKRYTEVIGNAMDANERCIKNFNSHIETLNEYRKDIDTMRKLIRICENHGIRLYEYYG